MSSLRSAVARLSGRLVRFILRRLGRQASTLPGAVARRLDPHILARLARDRRIICISGTNGKTTTTALIVQLLESGPLFDAQPGARRPQLPSNVYGANLSQGLITCLLSSKPGDIAVLEVDEAAFARVSVELQPELVVLTNVFADQLDRYGDMQAVVELLHRGVAATSPDCVLVYSGDDPNLVAIARASGRETRAYRALDQAFLADTEAPATPCPHCGETLDYRGVTIGHHGAFDCPACRFTNDEAQLSFALIDTGAERQYLMRGDGGEARVAFPLRGLYNAYNASAVLLAVEAFEGRRRATELAQELSSVRAAFGRQEYVRIGDTEACYLLVKNAAGYEEALRLIGESDEVGALAFILNNRTNDGVDIGWIEDVPIEILGLPEVPIGISGEQREALATRLRNAVTERDYLVMDSPLEMTLELARRCPPGRTLYILPNYSALFELRDDLKKQGLGGAR